MKVSCFEVVDSPMLKVADSIFVDEEGLLKSCDRFLFIDRLLSATGRQGLVLGSTRSGDTAAARTSLRAVRDAVTVLESDGCVYIPTLNSGGRRTRLTSAAINRNG